MLLTRLPDQSRVFCDANTLTYAFLGTEPLSPVCLALLERSARREIQLFTSREIHTSKRFRDEYGLLTDDSITLAVMRRHNLTDLASNDEDFHRVAGIRLWTPD